MYNGEQELLELRMNILDPYVDEFIICEAPTTFSGKPKELYFDPAKVSPWLHKIKYYVINEEWTEQEWTEAAMSPNTQGAAHWTHEFLQKESIKKALTHLNDKDIVFIGDCDEIWDIKRLDFLAWSPCKLKLDVYVYYLNNRSDEEFWGTLMGRYRDIKNKCLNHLRTHSQKTMFPQGWHFTSLKHQLRRKLQDSYTKESYATDTVMDNLEDNILKNRDFLGRSFHYWLDEAQWPEYLEKNSEKYLQIIK